MTPAKPARSDHPIPNGWQRVRLGDVAVINPKKPRLEIDADAPVTFVPMIAVGEDFSGIKDTLIRTFSEVSKGYTYFEEHDLLFSKITPCLQNGKHATARNLINGFGFGSTEFHVVRAADPVNPRFLFRTLTKPEIIKECADSFTGTAGQQRVQPDTLRALPILLPPLPEQRAIAAVLDSIDDAIEGAEEAIAATEGLRDALLHDLLTRGLPGQHTEFRDVPGLGTIPADWDVVRLGDVLDSTTYGTNSPLSADGAIPVLRMNNLQNGQIDLSDVRRANLVDKETRELNLIPGDILFNRTNSLALVGKVAVVRSLPQPISFASYLVRLRVQQGRANPFWLSALLWSDNCQSRIHKFATPSVSQANINPTNLKTLTIPLPSLAEQQAIAAALDGVDVAVGVARNETTKLRLLKESTAEALMTGRMRMEPIRL